MTNSLLANLENNDQMNDVRTAELKGNLQDIRERMNAAATSVGRAPQEVALTVVTKTYPADDVLRLYGLGVRDFAENRDQEATPKASAVAEVLGVGAGERHGATNLDQPTWHFVGQAQTNKANSIVRYATIIESIDRVKLARAIDKAATSQDVYPRKCLIQVNLDPEAPVDRGGAQPDLIPELAEAIATSESLELGGVMAVAPLGQDPRKAFENLAQIHQNLLRDFPGAGMMSAGMSSDFELAIQLGATHVRLGAAVLGQRETLR